MRYEIENYNIVERIWEKCYLKGDNYVCDRLTCLILYNLQIYEMC